MIKFQGSLMVSVSQPLIIFLAFCCILGMSYLEVWSFSLYVGHKMSIPRIFWLIFTGSFLPKWRITAGQCIIESCHLLSYWIMPWSLYWPYYQVQHFSGYVYKGHNVKRPWEELGFCISYTWLFKCSQLNILGSK